MNVLNAANLILVFLKSVTLTWGTNISQMKMKNWASNPSRVWTQSTPARDLCVNVIGDSYSYSVTEPYEFEILLLKTKQT